MKLKYEFESVTMDDEIILVPIGEKADKVEGVIKLNREGLEIVNMLKEDTTKERIVEVLSSKYENDRQVLELWVNNVIFTLEEANLIS